MRWVEKREVRALQRIVALLLALADVADRAGSMPLPVRLLVLAILRHAEAVAWAFASGTVCVPAACGRTGQAQHLPLPSVPVGDHPADVARLAASLRALALIVAHWAIRALSSTQVPSSERGVSTPLCARPGGSWRGPAALSAPDTS